MKIEKVEQLEEIDWALIRALRLCMKTSYGRGSSYDPRYSPDFNKLIHYTLKRMTYNVLDEAVTRLEQDQKSWEQQLNAPGLMKTLEKLRSHHNTIINMIHNDLITAVENELSGG